MNFSTQQFPPHFPLYVTNNINDKKKLKHSRPRFCCIIKVGTFSASFIFANNAFFLQFHRLPTFSKDSLMVALIMLSYNVPVLQSKLLNLKQLCRPRYAIQQRL